MLITKRFHLPIAAQQDAAAMARYYQINRDHLQPWEPQRRADPRKLDYWQAQLRQQEADHVAQTGLMLLIRAKDDVGSEADILGVIRFSQIFRGPFQACYLGFSLAQAAVGNGVMQEALATTIDHMFGAWHLHRIMANYLPRNHRSGALLGRLGFIQEGLAQNYLQINGTWEDHVLTARINTTLPPTIV